MDLQKMADKLHAAGWDVTPPEKVRAAVTALEQIDGGDPERAHGSADDVLLGLVAPEVRQAHEDLAERADGFWYA